jgi:hypothetical protein
MPDAKVVRTLYRELLRSGRIRVQQLARLNSAPLPELLERIPDKGPVSKWTNDEEVCRNSSTMCHCVNTVLCAISDRNCFDLPSFDLLLLDVI